MHHICKHFWKGVLFFHIAFPFLRVCSILEFLWKYFGVFRFLESPNMQFSGITEYAIFRNHRVCNIQPPPSTQYTYIYIYMYIAYSVMAEDCVLGDSWKMTTRWFLKIAYSVIPENCVLGGYSRVLGGTRGYSVPGPRSQVSGIGYQVSGPRSQVPGPRSQVPVPRSQVPGPRSQIIKTFFEKSLASPVACPQGFFFSPQKVTFLWKW